MKENNCLVIIALFIGGLITIIGCKKDDSVVPNAIKAGTEDGSIAQAVIGRGYDISGRFAYSEDIKEAVLDFSKLATDNKIIKDGNISETEVKVNEGETIKAYQASFNYSQTASGGIDGLFSAEVGYNFGYERAQSSDYSFATISSFTYKYGIYVDGRLNPSSLTGYASDQFLEDAASMSVETLINTYGTHVVVGGKWGASFDYSMSAQRTSVSNQYSFGAFVKAEATIEGINLGGSQELSAEFGTYYESGSKSIKTKAKGGNSEYALAITAASTPEGRDAAYASWIETIDENPAFCDYYQEGLVPIYEFIEDAALKSKVQTGIETYLEQQGIESIEPVASIITKNFDLKGFCNNVGTGDGDVDADGGGNIYIEVSFGIEEGTLNNYLNLSVNMKVHEQKGDYTKLEGSTEQTIYSNQQIASIELATTEYGFQIQNKFNPDNGVYFSPVVFLAADNQLPSWLSNVTICIDGSGSDENIIGVKGTLNVPVMVYPSTEKVVIRN